MVIVEAMACGTPIVATPRGSTPELIDEGVTGFLRRDDRRAWSRPSWSRPPGSTAPACGRSRRSGSPRTRMAAEQFELYGRSIADHSARLAA